MQASSPAPMRLAVHTVGAGPRLVLFHGGMGSHNHWIRNLAALAGRFTVHAVDLPGYGESPGVPRDISQPDYIALVLASLRAVVGDEAFHFAGFSFGSIIAAMCTVHLGAQVLRLSMVGPGGFGPNAEIPLKPIPPAHAGETARREVFRHNLAQLMIARPENVTEQAVDVMAENFRRTRYDGRHFSVTPNTPLSLARISCPVQVVFGGEDALWREQLPECIGNVRRARPQAKIVVLPGVGHWVQFEAADEVNRLLLDFHLS